jgi:hypothetical protein
MSNPLLFAGLNKEEAIFWGSDSLVILFILVEQARIFI